MTNKKTEYDIQAEKFLNDTGTTIEVMETVPQISPLWATKGEKHGISYSVTMKNKRGTYTFNFWGSIRDKDLVTLGEEALKSGFDSSDRHALSDETIKRGLNFFPMRFRFTHKDIEQLKEELKPSQYSILACLDVCQEDNFSDFCASYGYDDDSITAEKTYKAVLEQDRNLRKLFTIEELEQLQTIN